LRKGVISAENFRALMISYSETGGHVLTPFLGACLGSVEYRSAGQGKGSWSAGELPMRVVADEETAGCG